MPKRKMSVTVSEDVVSLLDRAAEKAGASRSTMLDLWLRRAARVHMEDELRIATIAYYESLSPTERGEEQALARASSRAARRLRIDGPRRRGKG